MSFLCVDKLYRELHVFRCVFSIDFASSRFVILIGKVVLIRRKEQLNIGHFEMFCMTQVSPTSEGHAPLRVHLSI